MQADAAAGRKPAAAVNGRQRHGARPDAAQWAKIIAAQRRSALTVVEFCRQQGIAKATFWYWRKRLVSAAKLVAAAQPVPRFLALPLAAPAVAQIEVDLGTLRMRLDGAAAARVVDAIVARVGRGAER
jgi:hypothetical protein